MSIESKNNGNVSNLDALNDVSLDSLHNPQEPKTTQPITTGSVEPQQSTTPITTEVDLANEDNNTPPANENDEVNTNSIKTFDDLVNVLSTKTSDTLSDDENEGHSCRRSRAAATRRARRRHRTPRRSRG